MGDSFILVDENSWNTSAVFFRRRRFLFLESNGKFMGCPPDDEMAIRELARLREEGAHFIMFVWPYLWWLDYYIGLARHLRDRYTVVLENDRLAIFDLCAPDGAAADRPTKVAARF